MAGLLPKFGQIDPELEGEPLAEAPVSKRSPSFGEIDMESVGIPSAPPPAFVPEERQQTSTTRRTLHTSSRPPHETPTRQTMEAVKIAAEETRIANAGVLANALRESRVESVGRLSSTTSLERSKTAPSASGVAARDNRVAEMRELYAQGNADAALALASSVADALDAEVQPPPMSFGAIEPIIDDAEADDLEAEDHTAIVEACADSSRLVVMTSRHIPRLLVGSKEITGLPIDPRAAFLVGHIDGIQTMEEILDVCAMPESEALALFEKLRVMGVIEID